MRFLYCMAMVVLTKKKRTVAREKASDDKGYNYFLNLDDSYGNFATRSRLYYYCRSNSYGTHTINLQTTGKLNVPCITITTTK